MRGRQVWGFGMLLGFWGLAGCEKPIAPAASSPADPPAQVLKRFSMQDLQNGLKAMTVQSIEGRLFEETHRAELEAPIVSFYKQGVFSSILKAPKGEVDTVSHVIEAWGGVTVVTADSATLTTERLRYNPERRKIFTDGPVRLEKPDSITEGKGLESDPELKSIKIGHQKVRFKSNAH